MAISNRTKMVGLLQPVEHQPAEEVTTVVDAKPAEKPKRRKPKQMKQVVIWVPITAAKLLKRIALDEDTTQQALIAEALNMLFSDRKKPPIA